MIRIGPDHERFMNLVKKRIEDHLQIYATTNAVLGKRSGDLVKLNIPKRVIPKFTYALQTTGGIGQGEGQEGQAIDPFKNQPPFSTEQRLMEVDISLDELTQMLINKLSLEHLTAKKGRSVDSEKRKYPYVGRVGSKVSTRRTLLTALRRGILAGKYDPNHPRLAIDRRDLRRYSDRVEPEKQSQAVLIYVLDTSDSLSMEKRQLLRITNHWVRTLLTPVYQHLEERYLIHQSQAVETSEEGFYRLREQSQASARISSAYQLALKILQQDYPQEQCNAYLFDYSTGFNPQEDNQHCATLLVEELLPRVKVFGYAQAQNQLERKIAPYHETYHALLRNKVNLSEPNKKHQA